MNFFDKIKAIYNIVGLTIIIIACTNDTNTSFNKEPTNVLNHKEKISLKFSDPTFIHHRVVLNNELISAIADIFKCKIIMLNNSTMYFNFLFSFLAISAIAIVCIKTNADVKNDSTVRSSDLKEINDWNYLGDIPNIGLNKTYFNH